MVESRREGEDCCSAEAASRVIRPAVRASVLDVGKFELVRLEAH